MKSIKLNKYGDIDLSQKTIQTVDGQEQKYQKIKNILSMRKGEFFYNVERGLDHDEILGKNITDEQIKDAIREALIGIADVTNIEIERQKDRNIKINFKLGGIDKEVIV